MSSMADFASALSGAPPAAAPDPTQDPTQGGGYDPTQDPTQDPSYSPGGGADYADASDTGADADAAGSGYSNSLEALDGAEQALQAFIQLDPDEGDRAIAAQCLQNVIKLKASNQSSAQSGDLSSLQRALIGGAGANAG